MLLAQNIQDASEAAPLFILKDSQEDWTSRAGVITCAITPWSAILLWQEQLQWLKSLWWVFLEKLGQLIRHSVWQDMDWMFVLLCKGKMEWRLDSKVGLKKLLTSMFFVLFLFFFIMLSQCVWCFSFVTVFYYWSCKIIAELSWGYLKNKVSPLLSVLRERP